MIYKALSNLRHRDSSEFLASGTFISDEGEYRSGEALQAGDIQFCVGWLTGRTQAEKNRLLFGATIQMVDKSHSDYDKLVELGIISQPKTKDKDKS